MRTVSEADQINQAQQPAEEQYEIGHLPESIRDDIWNLAYAEGHSGG